MKAISRWLDRFCYNHPKLGIPELMKYIMIGNVIIYIGDLFTNNLFSWFTAFYPELILHGQIWRIFTFIFTPVNAGGNTLFTKTLFFALSTFFYYWIGTSLERHWGTTRFNVFYGTGVLLNLILGTSTDFMTESSAFRTIYIASGIWQDAGWGCIIYLATLANVDPGLYEAAKMDGASVFQRILNIDIPELLPMAVLNLIMAAGGLMNVGFEKVWLLQTDLNKATSDVIAVYVYQQGIENAKYSYSTAVGLFNTAVNIILLIIVNKIASKLSDVEFV